MNKMTLDGGGANADRRVEHGGVSSRLHRCRVMLFSCSRQAQLGDRALAAPQAEEECLCVVCMDERKQHAMVPCMHMCVCSACAQRLLDAQTPHCPVCRTPVESTTRVFF